MTLGATLVGRKEVSYSILERTENYLKAVNFENPEWIPCRVSLMPATWRKYREALEEVVLRHPKIFPDYKKGSINFDAIADPGYKRGRFTDSWGCVWENVEEGLEGMVVVHPLKDWKNLESYIPPDPLIQGERGRPADWERLREVFREKKLNGELASGGLPHGFMYMRLYYLRGFENLMIDIATDEPRLEKLIDMVLDYNIKFIEKWIEVGADLIHFGDDLGNQDRLPISPEKFRKYLKPCYKKMFSLCQKNNVYVYFHSDGHILEIIDDLIDCGVDILNPQVGANTIDGLVETAKSKVCIDLDLDRQLFPFAKPQEIREHIREAVEKLNSPRGGLMLIAECEPDVPLENIETICTVLEEIGGPSI
ncbi:MAG TPA: uroporphyrinogen decarboxylase family protein [Candidatus Atribacteria bacterium]|nr:uroporphyrinogen decarboxylase family protein [Candidatus Atribacteria bacterium]